MGLDRSRRRAAGAGRSRRRPQILQRQPRHQRPAGQIRPRQRGLAARSPHRPVVDLQATLGEFSHQSAYGEIRPPAPLHQPTPSRSSDFSRRQANSRSPLASEAAAPTRCRSFGLATAFGLRAALWSVATAASTPACRLRYQLDVTEALLFWASNSGWKQRQ